MVRKSTQLGIITLLILGLLIGASLTTHQPYNKHTISITGQPVELSEDTPDSEVLSQADMTAKEYQAANYMMSNSLQVKTYPQGSAWGMTPPEDYELGGLGGTITITHKQAMQFTEYEYIQVDSHHYKLFTSTEEIEPTSYLTVFEVMGSLLFAMMGMIHLMRLLEWYESQKYTETSN